MGDLGLIPGLRRSLGEGKSYPFQYSDLENSMDCIVHGVAKSSVKTERLYCEALCFTHIISFEPHDNPKIDGYHSHFTDDETVGLEIVNDV